MGKPIPEEEEGGWKRITYALKGWWDFGFEGGLGARRRSSPSSSLWLEQIEPRAARQTHQHQQAPAGAHQQAPAGAADAAARRQQAQQMARKPSNPKATKKQRQQKMAAKHQQKKATKQQQGKTQQPKPSNPKQQQQKTATKKLPAAADAATKTQHQNAHQGRMIEVKKWTTQQTDQGWHGRLVGLKWEGATKFGEEGNVEERWLWTLPREADKSKDKGQNPKKRKTRGS